MLLLLVLPFSPALLLLLLRRPERPLQVLARFEVVRVDGDGVSEGGGRLAKRSGAEERIGQIEVGVAPDLAARATLKRRLVPPERFGKRPFLTGGRAHRLTQPVVDPGDVEIVLGRLRNFALRPRKGPKRLLEAARFEVFRPLAGVPLASAEELRRRQEDECGADHDASPGLGGERRRRGGPKNAAIAIAATASPAGIQNRSR